ncbi:MAG TPA: NAD(P)/FAD-dependent oxidoreductase [Candidatus Polarisedimenticolaceae bacterium]
MKDTGRPRVVVVGAGFGGLGAARALAKAPVDVVLIDRNNYHLFQPLLYQVAVAGLNPADIAYPVRTILRRQKNLEFRLSEIRGFDVAAKVVKTTDGDVPYDFLVVGIGAETNFFGLDDVRAHGLGLKDLNDARRIRNHVMYCVERASLEKDVTARNAWLTLVVVGGGPTGVEMAGAFAELVRLVLARDFRRLDLDRVRIVLLEAGDRILSGFPADLSRAAMHSLDAKRVEVRLEHVVENYDGEKVYLRGGEVIPAKTLIWAAGIRPSSILEGLGAELDRGGRVPVGATLQLPGRPEVFVIGDAAAVDWKGSTLPQVAQPAMQTGTHAGRSIARLVSGREPEPFRYLDLGNLATIGRNEAIADLGRLHFTGLAAWIVWLFVHLIQLVGFRNRVVVLVNWIWDYFAYKRAAPLIVREAEPPPDK